MTMLASLLPYSKNPSKTAREKNEEAEKLGIRPLWPKDFAKWQKVYI